MEVEHFKHRILPIPESLQPCQWPGKACSQSLASTGTGWKGKKSQSGKSSSMAVWPLLRLIISCTHWAAQEPLWGWGSPFSAPSCFPPWPQPRQSSLDSALQLRIILPIPDGHGQRLCTYWSNSDHQKRLNFLTNTHERFVGFYLNNTLEAAAISLKPVILKGQTLQDQRKQRKTNRYFWRLEDGKTFLNTLVSSLQLLPACSRVDPPFSN